MPIHQSIFFHYWLISAAACIALLGGCGQDSPDSPTPTPASTSTSTPSNARTLTSCNTSIETNVPDFYKLYFKCVDISMDGETVVIHTENLPPHPSFYYATNHPNYIPYTAKNSESFRVPGDIATQDITIRIPQNPVSRNLTINASLVDGNPGSSNNEYKMGPAGIALDSVILFNPLARPGDDIEDEIHSFDAYNAHPAGNTYHYHTTSPGPLEVLEHLNLTAESTPGQSDIELYGIMCDGTLVLGCTELDGSSPDESNLDAQNGHSHDITNTDDQTFFQNRYHTHICAGQTPFSGHRFTPEIQYYSQCSVQ